MSGLLNFVDNNQETLQQMALLAYLRDPDQGEPFLQAITAYKVGKSVFKYVSKDDQIEAARNECILNIAAYCKSHPRARQDELQKKVQEEVEKFRLKISTL